MASPLKTWTSVFLILVACWAVAFNCLQFYTVTESHLNPNFVPSVAAATVGKQEVLPGLVGTGILILFLAISALVVFTHRHERPRFRRSQMVCYVLVWVGLVLTAALHLVGWAIAQDRTHPKLTLNLNLALSSLRILIGGAIVGCGVHALHA